VSATASPLRYRRPFTILWGALYLISLALTIWTDFPVEVGLYVILGLGIPLTVLMSMEWSTRLPGRKIALWLVMAGAAWWLASAVLIRAEYEWRLWGTVNTLTLLLVTFTIGYWLAGEVERVGHLIPVSILGTLVDIWSVFRGPSKSVGEQVAEHAQRQAETGVWQPPPFVELLLLNWPQPGAPYMTPVFGFGDLVFIALFVAGSRRFGLSLVKNVLLLLAGLAVAVVLAFLYGPMPALPFICGFFLLGNLRSLSMTRKEWQATVLICLAVLVVGFLTYLRSMVPAE